MKKLTSFTILSLFVLSGCGKATENITVAPPVEKKPFHIETRMIGVNTESFSVEKSARLTAGSALTLTAESVGEVSAINVKEGSKINKGSRLISLRDTVNSYDLRVAQAQNSVSLQEANIASTRVSLDRAVFDSQIAYDQAKRSYDNLISKNNLILETLKNTNQKTLDSYNESYKTYLSSIEGFMTNFLYEGDKIMGMTSAYEYANDGWEPYLGIRIGDAYSLAKTAWNKTYTNRGEIRAKKEKGNTISEENIQADLDLITLAYKQTQSYVDAVIYMLQNNAIGAGLPQAMQDGWVANWNGIKSQIQGSEASYNAWRAQTLSFFQNYKNTEKATELALKSLERKLTPEEESLLDTSKDMRIVYQTTLIDLKDRTLAAKLALNQADNARKTAEKTRDTTLNQLSVGKQTGVISLEQAQREYSKLTISAPFDGTVTKVIATPGQRVNPGTPMIEVVSNMPEVVIDLDSDIVSSLKVGDIVDVKVDDKIMKGTITAISRAAGANLLYTTRISVSGALGLIGSAASVLFETVKETAGSGVLEKVILPLRSVKIISEQEGEIVLLQKDGTIEYRSIALGKVVGDAINIETPLDPKTEIILSDISNFDPEKFFFKKNLP